MAISMYVAPGQGQTTPGVSSFSKSNVLSLWSFAASFFPLNYCDSFSIQTNKLCTDLESPMLYAKYQGHRTSGYREEF